MTVSRSLLCLALAAISTPLIADTVWLKNGDKLTGTIELVDGGKLLLKTDYAGSITLDLYKVATLESERELLVKQDDFTGERAKSLKPAGEGQVEHRGDTEGERERRRVLPPLEVADGLGVDTNGVGEVGA